MAARSPRASRHGVAEGDLLRFLNAHAPERIRLVVIMPRSQRISLEAPCMCGSTQEDGR